METEAKPRSLLRRPDTSLQAYARIRFTRFLLVADWKGSTGAEILSNWIVKMQQPGLFESSGEDVRIEDVIRFALGDFRSRGLELGGRTLALDRLLGAFRRAYEEFGIEPVSDSEIAEGLRAAGAFVEELPAYVAKHPYRVTVPEQLAVECLEYFESRRAVKEN